MPYSEPRHVREQLENPVGQTSTKRDPGRPRKDFNIEAQPSVGARAKAAAVQKQLKQAQIDFEAAEEVYEEACRARAEVFFAATQEDSDEPDPAKRFRGVSLPAMAGLLSDHGLTVRQIRDDIEVYVKGTKERKYRRKPRL